MGLAGWWEKHGAPRVIKIACGMPAIQKLRAKIVPLAEGDVFEIGCGGGINQSFYNRNAVTSFAGIDPGDKLIEYARAAAHREGLDADIRKGVGEDIPFRANSFDSVVCTYTLCSVRDQARVIEELRRILRPGGRLFFLEHGQAPDISVARMQHRIEPYWKPLAGGCHLTRPVTQAIRKVGGFGLEPGGGEYLRGAPRILGWNEWGIGIKQA